MKNLLIALFLVSTIYIIERGQTDNGGIHIYRVCVNGYEYVMKTGGGGAVQSFGIDDNIIDNKISRSTFLPIKCDKHKKQEKQP